MIRYSTIVLLLALAGAISVGQAPSGTQAPVLHPLQSLPMPPNLTKMQKLDLAKKAIHDAQTVQDLVTLTVQAPSVVPKAGLDFMQPRSVRTLDNVAYLNKDSFVVIEFGVGSVGKPYLATFYVNASHDDTFRLMSGFEQTQTVKKGPNVLSIVFTPSKPGVTTVALASKTTVYSFSKAEISLIQH